jgi:hypothetical protein
MPFIGYDPINLENYDILEWLMMDKDNIVLNVIYSKKNTHSLFLLKKSYFEIPNLNDIFTKCVFYNNTFLPKESYNSKDHYINIGYLIGINCLISKKDIKKNLLKKNIINLEIKNKEDYFINREYLLLQYIGLSKKLISKSDKKDVIKEKKEYNKNLPYKIDVYFEKILADALFNYSSQWDAPINNYLRHGEDYFETNIFKNYQHRYGNTREIAIQNIKDKITKLDRVFLEAAPRNEDDETVYWRGMKTPFENLTNINDSIIALNFLSLSINYLIAENFSHIPNGGNCCIYKFILDKGVPYINMINTTKYKYEKEILIPRNLTCTLVNKEYFDYYGQPITIYVLRVSLNNITNFKIHNMCKPYYNANLTENKDKKLLDYISIKSVNKIKKSSSKKITLEEKNKKLLDKKEKLPRCPKGTRRNKKTGLCEPSIIFNKKEKPPRCPKGTRRNKKTGVCEPK